MNIRHIFPVVIAFFILGINPTTAQTSDCDGRYDCWVRKAHDALRLEQFIAAANRFAAAQVCDDAPLVDTLDEWIEKSYQRNIALIEKQKKEAALNVKESQNQEIANNITEDFARIMQQEDVTLQALLLQHACKKTQNTNKLAMRARREILCNQGNLFYKRSEPVNVNYLIGNSDISVNLPELQFSTIVSKDGSFVVEVNELGIFINHLFKNFERKLPPIVQAKLSPNSKYLFLQTLDKGSMNNDVYVASKSSVIKHSYCILKLDDFKLIQDLTTVNQIATVAFSQSSDSLIMIQNDGQILIKDLKRNISTLNGTIKATSKAPITNLLMTHFGQKLLVSDANGGVVLYDSKGKVMKRFPIFHHAQITDWDITHNDKYVISGSKDSTVLLWDLSDKPKGFGHYKFKDIVSSVSFSPDDSFSIASSMDKSVIIKDNKGNNIKQVRGSNYSVIKCGFSSNGNTLFTLDMMNLKTFNFKMPNYDIAGLDIWPDHFPQRLKGDMIFSKNNKYKIYKNTEGVSHLIEKEKGEILTFDSLTTYLFSPEDDYILTIKKDSAFAWDLTKKELLWTLKSKLMITDARFSKGAFDHYLLLEDNINSKAELWDLKDSKYVPQTTFKDNFVSPKFIANGLLLVNVNFDANTNIGKTVIRKTNEPRTIIATLNDKQPALYFSEKDSILYALYPSEIETENKVIDTKYTLFEVNIKDKEKNVKLQPSLHFDIPTYTDVNFDFSSTGDSILFKSYNEVFVYQNTIKLMNENRLLPNTVLDIAAKRDNGILTKEDCTERKDLKDMSECALYYADAAREATNDDSTYISLFDQVMETANHTNLNVANLSKEDRGVWQNLDINLSQIVASYPYKTHYKEKIKITRQIIDIKEKILGDKNSKELGVQYGNLCWFILFDENPNKFQKSLEYGTKAVELNSQDWINANLGHTYLFLDQFDKAITQYSFLLERMKDVTTDFDILEKSDITHPRMNEMREKLTDMFNKLRKY
jgi:WD40 repeat protein